MKYLRGFSVCHSQDWWAIRWPSNPHWGGLLEKGIVSALLLDLGGVWIIGGKDFLRAVCGQLAATALGLVPQPVLEDSLLRFLPERNISSGFTDRCSHHFISIGLSVHYWARADPWARSTPAYSPHVLFYIYFPKMAPVGVGGTQEAEKKGSAVRGSRFVVAFVAGVLPFRVKARCLKLQPVLTSAGLKSDQSSITDEL